MCLRYCGKSGLLTGSNKDNKIGMSLIFIKSIIQHNVYIDIRIKITQKISIFSRAEF